MAQVTSGIRGIFSHPTIYSTFQNIMGAHSVRTILIKEFVRPDAGNAILDIGCGTADILGYLPDVDYYGFDISEAYITRANKRFSRRGKFYCKKFMESDVEILPKVDIVLALGLLHHLDDGPAANLMRLASLTLKPGGRLITFDPCFDDDQNFIARYLVSIDRGQNVRNRKGYNALATKEFETVRLEVRHRAWIPYTHCFMECIKK